MHHCWLPFNTRSCCWSNLGWKTTASHSSCSARGHHPVSRCMCWCNHVFACLTWPSTSRAPWRWGSIARPRLEPCRWPMRTPWRWWRRSSLLAWRWSNRPCWGKATAHISPAGAFGSRHRRSTMRTWTRPQRWAGRTSCKCRSTTVGRWLVNAFSSVSPGQYLWPSQRRPAWSSYRPVSCRPHAWLPAGLVWKQKLAVGTTSGCVTQERSGHSRHFCSQAAACCMWSLTAHLPRRSQQPEPVWWSGRWRGQKAKSFQGWWSVCWHRPAGHKVLPNSLWRRRVWKLRQPGEGRKSAKG